MSDFKFTDNERNELLSLTRNLLRQVADLVRPGDFRRVRTLMAEGSKEGLLGRDRYGMSVALRNLRTAHALCEMVSADRNMVIATLIHRMCGEKAVDSNTGERLCDPTNDWDSDIAKLVEGLLKVDSLYSKQASVESDNFRNLLLTFARDIRVIIIMIVDRLMLMRSINHHPNDEFVKSVAIEANYLYAPLAHRLGLYVIKSELEDMSLKYTSRDTYTRIAHKLNETKKERDAYIANFIGPIKQKLEDAGLKFDIKGRTKSIYSIWNKMKKQHADIDQIYDLFAIRIIIDTPPLREKSDCWLAYSIITDMYQPNPSRMKDWISIPKSNGYESLHITVIGPDGKWVEVQIRTRRMDLVAEKGLAAHWKYKGIKSEGDLDAWMNNVRDILEAAHTGPMELMRNFKMDIYDKEVFVFTPRGDLYRLPLGATVLDFAFHIHSKLGCIATGGKVNGKNQKLNYRLHSGDTVEVITSSTQQPRRDWLTFVVTSKARNKIRQTLNEHASRQAELGREMLQRRFKNRKIDLEEAVLMKVIKKLGYKTVTDFFNEVADQQLDVGAVIDAYLALQNPDGEAVETRSAEEFTLQPAQDTEQAQGDGDVLVIGNDVKGLNYRLAKCCNPIYGDNVFGFVSAEGVIKVHRNDCPNAVHLRERYPYRVITTRWSGKAGGQLAATLRVIGHDDIGIVTNISSIINKEKNVTLRAISIDSNDGLFQGHLTVGINDTTTLNNLIKKIKTVKGVKDVERSK